MIKRYFLVPIVLVLITIVCKATLFVGVQGPLDPVSIIAASIDRGSSCAYTSGATSGTVIGNASCTLSSGSCAATWTTSGTAAADFTFSTAQLKTNGATPTCSSPTTLNLNIVATQGGVVGSPFPKAITVTCNPSGGTVACDFGPNAASIPAPATAAG